MNSCLYRGIVIHRRFQPKAHAFRFRLFMLYLDLAELDHVFAGRWLWSSRKPAIAWFRREDHFGDPRQNLSEAVRDTVENALGQRPLGPIRLLTHLRYFGYCFNPISVFYCFDDKGDSIETLVAEVTNTPWSERRLYVLGAPTPSGIPASVRFAKTLHVSPFMPMDLEYVWRSDIPGDRLSIHMNVVRGDDPLLDATLALQRENITGHHLAMSLLRQPLMTLKVIAGIHWEAVRLWLKGVPVFDHPAKASAPGRSENITHR